MCININFEISISNFFFVSSIHFFSNNFIFPQDSPNACATLRNPGKIKIHGCERNVKVKTRTTSTITLTTTTLTTTTRLKLPRPRFSRVTSPSVLLSTETDDNSTEFNVTTANPALQMESESPFVITLSVVTPASFLLIGGFLMYIQYRRGAGLSYGCIPWRRNSNPLRIGRSSKKAKHSDNSDEESPPPPASKNSDIEAAAAAPPPPQTALKRMMTRSQRQNRKGNMTGGAGKTTNKITTLGPNSSALMDSSSENSLYTRNSVV